MNSRAIVFLGMLICIIIGCGSLPKVRTPIVNPQLIDRKEAKSKLMNVYTTTIANDFYSDKLARAAFLCRDIEDQKRLLEGVKSSPSGRKAIILYSPRLTIFNTFAFINFNFSKNASIYRECTSEYCRVWIKNGSVCFGEFSQNEVDNISLKDSEMNDENDCLMNIQYMPSETTYSELLFGYETKNQKQGEELISLFLSAFPLLKYE